eukprot:m51a1_g9069 hypothetical protein (547) ;mRNA; f:107136-111824
MGDNASGILQLPAGSAALALELKDCIVDVLSRLERVLPVFEEQYRRSPELLVRDLAAAVTATQVVADKTVEAARRAGGVCPPANDNSGVPDNAPELVRSAQQDLDWARGFLLEDDNPDIIKVAGPLERASGKLRQIARVMSWCPLTTVGSTDRKAKPVYFWNSSTHGWARAGQKLVSPPAAEGLQCLEGMDPRLGKADLWFQVSVLGMLALEVPIRVGLVTSFSPAQSPEEMQNRYFVVLATRKDPREAGKKRHSTPAWHVPLSLVHRQDDAIEDTIATITEESSIDLSAVEERLSEEEAQRLMGMYEAAADKATGEAVGWLRTAAELGNHTAQHRLGTCHFKGVPGVLSPDPREAIRLWTLAADAGVVDSQLNLAQMHSNGQYVPLNYAEAFDRSSESKLALLSESADNGVPDAQFELGLRYFDGAGVARDRAEAARLWRLAADAGHGQSQFNLGALLWRGDGVARDEALAMHYFALAADNDIPMAQFNLGTAAYEGIAGVPRSAERAAALWSAASAPSEHAPAGLAPAQYNLGVLYSNGDGLLI